MLESYIQLECGPMPNVMAALCNRGPLYFCPVISIVYRLSFFSSPNLSGHRLDLYHTSTHRVALVRIQNACLKCAVRGSLQIQDAKKSPKIAIWFHAVSFFFFYSSPNLSGQRLDVCHTSTHGVALVRIQNACLKCAVRGSLKTQKSRKRSPSGHHRTTLSGYIFAIKARMDNRKKNFLSTNISSTCPPQYGELRPTSG